MICEYFAGAVNAVLKVEREPLCVSANRIEVSNVTLVIHYLLNTLLSFIKLLL